MPFLSLNQAHQRTEGITVHCSGITIPLTDSAMHGRPRVSGGPCAKPTKFYDATDLVSR